MPYVLCELRYYVNWASPMIEKATWLDNAGCAAVMDKCLTAGSDPPAIVSGGTGFFCNVAGETGCTSDRSAGGYCSVTSYSSDVNSSYQYFPGSSTAGSTHQSDYCPYLLPYSNKKCIDTHNSQTGRLDIFSSTSKCFESTVGGFSNLGSACYQYSCSSSGMLSITVGTQGTTTTKTCTTGGEQLAVSDITSSSVGYVKCPENITTLCGTHHYNGEPLIPNHLTSAPTTTSNPTSEPTTATPTKEPTPFTPESETCEGSKFEQCASGLIPLPLILLSPLAVVESQPADPYMQYLSFDANLFEQLQELSTGTQLRFNDFLSLGIVVDLRVHQVLADNAMVLVVGANGTQSELQRPTAVHLTGVAHGDLESMVFISLRPAGSTGFIRSGELRFSIEAAPEANQHSVLLQGAGAHSH